MPCEPPALQLYWNVFCRVLKQLQKYHRKKTQCLELSAVNYCLMAAKYVCSLKPKESAKNSQNNAVYPAGDIGAFIDSARNCTNIRF